MLQSHKFPRITFTLMTLALIAYTFTIIAIQDNMSVLIVILMIVVTTAAIILMTVLSTTIVHKLASEITTMINESNDIDITPEDIKRLGRACVKLDKYNVLYEIDLERAVIVAHVSMGMYTRMSVADNLDYSVEYHIVGTNTILYKLEKTK